MIDLVRESPLFQEAEKEAIEKEQKKREAALAEEKQQNLKDLRQLAIGIVKSHYSNLVRLTKKQLKTIQTKETLMQVILQLNDAVDATAAEEILLALDGDNT